MVENIFGLCICHVHVTNCQVITFLSVRGLSLTSTLSESGDNNVLNKQWLLLLHFALDSACPADHELPQWLSW